MPEGGYRLEGEVGVVDFGEGEVHEEGDYRSRALQVLYRSLFGNSVKRHWHWHWFCLMIPRPNEPSVFYAGDAGTSFWR